MYNLVNSFSKKSTKSFPNYELVSRQAKNIQDCTISFSGQVLIILEFCLDSLEFLNCFETFRLALEFFGLSGKINYFRKILRNVYRLKVIGIFRNLFIISSKFGLWQTLEII